MKKKNVYKLLIILFLILDLMAITKPNGYSCKEMRHYYQWEKCDNYTDLFFIALASETTRRSRKHRGAAITTDKKIRIGAFGVWF